MQQSNTEIMRRRSLVDATINEIGRAGSLEITVGQIAKKAGVSSALAHHYFGSKDQIFLAAMRHLLRNFGTSVHDALAQSNTPRSRIESVIKTSFSEVNFSSDIISAWLNFYVQAQNSAEVQRLLRVYQRRLQSNLSHDLRPLVGKHAPEIAQGLGAMIDGFYIRQALRRGNPDRDHAISQTLTYLDLNLERYGLS